MLHWPLKTFPLNLTFFFSKTFLYVNMWLPLVVNACWNKKYCGDICVKLFLLSFYAVDAPRSLYEFAQHIISTKLWIVKSKHLSIYFCPFKYTMDSVCIHNFTCSRFSLLHECPHFNHVLQLLPSSLSLTLSLACLLAYSLSIWPKFPFFCWLLLNLKVKPKYKLKKYNFVTFFYDLIIVVIFFISFNEDKKFNTFW